MPLSLTTASQFWNTESFKFWDPVSDTFGPGVQGRMRRIDPFVSLWSKASRRGNVHFVPGTDVSGVEVVRHALSGTIFLLSQTFEVNSWQNGTTYNEMHRVHKATPPSGGKGTYLPVTVSGTGADLGPVTVGPGVPVYLDVERSGDSSPDETIAVTEQDFYLLCSNNITHNPGDFILLDGSYYRADEWFHDTGFLAAKAVKAPPSYTTVTFLLHGTSAPVFDPESGAFGTGTYDERQVSALIDASEAVGRPTDLDFEERLTLYIYTHHIGFAPAAGQQVEIGDRVYRVVRVDHNVSNLQWKVEVKP